MNEILEKLKRVSGKISNIKGPFIFFGLFKRNVPEDKWDIVVSAKWFSKKESDLIFFLETLKSEFGDHIEFLETIQMVPPDDDFIKEFIKISEGKALPLEFKNHQIQDVVFANFYIIESSSGAVKNPVPVKTDQRESHSSESD